MDVLSRRLGRMQLGASDDCADETMQVDEASNVMLPEDQESVEQEKKRVHVGKEGFADFAKSFSSHRARVRAAAEGPPEAKKAGR